MDPIMTFLLGPLIFLQLLLSFPYESMETVELFSTLLISGLGTVFYTVIIGVIGGLLRG